MIIFTKMCEAILKKDLNLFKEYFKILRAINPAHINNYYELNNGDKLTPLHLALKVNSKEMVKELLEEGFADTYEPLKINNVDETILDHFPNSQAMDALLDYVNNRSGKLFKSTPLYLADIKSMRQFIKEHNLAEHLKAPADALIKDFIYQVNSNFCDLNILNRFLALGGDPNYIRGSSNLLIIAILATGREYSEDTLYDSSLNSLRDKKENSENSEHLINNFREKIVRLLLAVGADPNHSPNGCFSAFHQAIVENRYNFVKIFLEAKADVNAIMPYKVSPLYYMLEVLWTLKKKNDIAVPDRQEKIAQTEKLIHCFIDKGADLNCSSSPDQILGKTALELARECSDEIALVMKNKLLSDVKNQNFLYEQAQNCISNNNIKNFIYYFELLQSYNFDSTSINLLFLTSSIGSNSIEIMNYILDNFSGEIDPETKNRINRILNKKKDSPFAIEREVYTAWMLHPKNENYQLETDDLMSIETDELLPSIRFEGKVIKENSNINVAKDPLLKKIYDLFSKNQSQEEINDLFQKNKYKELKRLINEFINNNKDSKNPDLTFNLSLMLRECVRFISKDVAQLDCVELLLNAQADPYYVVQNEKPAIDLAIETNNIIAVKLMIESVGFLDPYRLIKKAMVDSGRKDIVLFLLPEGVNHLTSVQLLEFLDISLRYALDEVTQFLLDKKIDVNGSGINMQTDIDFVPLFSAICSYSDNSAQYVGMLIDRGADIYRFRWFENDQAYHSPINYVSFHPKIKQQKEKFSKLIFRDLELSFDRFFNRPSDVSFNSILQTLSMALITLNVQYSSNNEMLLKLRAFKEQENFQEIPVKKQGTIITISNKEKGQIIRNILKSIKNNDQSLLFQNIVTQIWEATYKKEVDKLLKRKKPIQSEYAKEKERIAEEFHRFSQKCQAFGSERLYLKLEFEDIAGSAVEINSDSDNEDSQDDNDEVGINKYFVQMAEFDTKINEKNTNHDQVKGKLALFLEMAKECKSIFLDYDFSGTDKKDSKAKRYKENFSDEIINFKTQCANIFMNYNKLIQAKLKLSNMLRNFEKEEDVVQGREYVNLLRKQYSRIENYKKIFQELKVVLDKQFERLKEQHEFLMNYKKSVSKKIKKGEDQKRSAEKKEMDEKKIREEENKKVKDLEADLNLKKVKRRSNWEIRLKKNKAFGRKRQEELKTLKDQKSAIEKEKLSSNEKEKKLIHLENELQKRKTKTPYYKRKIKKRLQNAITADMSSGLSQQLGFIEACKQLEIILKELPCETSKIELWGDSLALLEYLAKITDCVMQIPTLANLSKDDAAKIRNAIRHDVLLFPMGSENIDQLCQSNKEIRKMTVQLLSKFRKLTIVDVKVSEEQVDYKNFKETESKILNELNANDYKIPSENIESSKRELKRGEYMLKFLKNFKNKLFNHELTSTKWQAAKEFVIARLGSHFSFYRKNRDRDDEEFETFEKRFKGYVFAGTKIRHVSHVKPSGYPELSQDKSSSSSMDSSAALESKGEGESNQVNVMISRNYVPTFDSSSSNGLGLQEFRSEPKSVTSVYFRRPSFDNGDRKANK